MKFKGSNKHNNGNRANQHRKTQGQFLSKQDREAHLFSKKLNNGGNKQDKTPLDLYNNILETGSILNGETNPLKQEEGVRFIDGSKPHTPFAKGLLLLASAFSVTHPKTTAPPRNGEGISTDNQNGLSSTVKNFTEMSKIPVFFDTTSATTPTSQNHDKSKYPTKRSEIKLAKEQKVSDEYDQSRVKRAVGDGHIINGNELNFSDAPLNTKILKQKLENSNITILHLWDVEIDPQKAQEIGTILKNSKVSTLRIACNGVDTRWIKELMVALKDTNIIVLRLDANDISSEYAKEIGENLKGTKVEELSLAHNNMRAGATDLGIMLADTEVTTLNLARNKIGDEIAIGLIKSLKKGNTKVKVLNLALNNISNKGAEDLIPELTDTHIIEVDLWGNKDIEPETLQKISKVLEHNRHVNEESYTSTMESSTTEEEPATSKDISHTGKREKRDIHTTNEPTSSPTEDTTVTEEDLTTSIPEGSGMFV